MTNGVVLGDIAIDLTIQNVSATTIFIKESLQNVSIKSQENVKGMHHYMYMSYNDEEHGSSKNLMARSKIS